jgi:hypothetical protein
VNFKQFFQCFRLSFYSASFYLAVAKKWQNWGLRFLLQLSLLIGSFSSLVMFFYILSFDVGNNSISNFLQSIPEIKIDQGKAVFIDEEIKQPVIIKANNQIFINLDLSDNANYAPKAVFNLFKDRITLNFNQFDIPMDYQYLVNITGQEVINYKAWVKILQFIKRMLLSIILILGFTLVPLTSFIFMLIKSVFYALLANLFLRFGSNQIDLKGLIRLANIAQAPASAISCITSFIFLFTGYFPFVQSLVSSLYVFYFVWAILIYKKSLKD